MNVLLVLIGVAVAFIIGSLLLVMYAFTRVQAPGVSKSAEPPVSSSSPFRWRFVALPLLICLLTFAMVAWFYTKLPDDVASRFAADGSPLGVVAKNILVMWAIIPQLLLTMLALAVAWGATRLSTLTGNMSGVRFGMDTLLLVMGNMVALPQLILGFAMLNTFSYNAYQVRPVPLWAVVIIVAIAGAVILGAFFIGALRKALEGNKKPTG
jgi:uncharacterized membrane protein